MNFGSGIYFLLFCISAACVLLRVRPYPKAGQHQLSWLKIGV